MKERLIFKKLFLVWIILILFLFVCQDDSYSQPKPIKFGALLTLTGPLAKPGEDIKKAIELAKEDINKAGGIKALNGAQLEIVYGDSQARPDIAVGETERLIERENVLAVMDMYPSACTVAASAVGERFKTPFVAGNSFADILTQRGFKYFFQIEAKTGSPGAGASWHQVEYMEYLSKVAGRKFERVAVIYEDSDYGQYGAKGIREFLGKKGYKIVEDISYPRTIPDVTPVVSKLKAAKAEVVLMCSYLGDSILLTRTADRLGFNVPWIDQAGKASDTYIKNVGPLAEYDNILGMWNKDIGPKAKELNDRFRAKTGEDLTVHGALLYQSVIVLKEALELAKKADREALREVLTKIRIEPGPDLILPREFIKFREDGMNIGGSFIYLQVQNGVFVTVWPEKYAAAKAKISSKWWK